MRLGLVVTMLDEVRSVCSTFDRVGEYFDAIEIVQSGEDSFPDVEERVLAHDGASYIRFPNLDQRSATEKEGPGERFDIGAISQARNFSHGFNHIRPAELDFIVGIHGDTAIDGIYGIRRICRQIMERGADIGVSRAMGQNFHAATLTREEMADPDHPMGGRIQDETVKDFMPQFFIAKTWLATRLSCITVTNPWCMEQCIGDSIGDAVQFVFCETAYGFNEGIRYHVPSPLGWKH